MWALPPWLLLQSWLAIGADAEAAHAKGMGTCPCMEWSGLDRYVQDGYVIYSPVGTGPSYQYPSTYGNLECKAHDKDLPPFCSRPNPPAWCAQEWCFVDKNNCDGVQYYDSSYFPEEDVYYSYETCGSANSFTLWYEAGEEGNTGVKVVDILEGYLWSSRVLLEESYIELSNQFLSKSCEYSTMCPCYECFQNEAWKSKIDLKDVGAWIKPDIPTDLARMASCLTAGISQGYSKVAAKESEAGKRVGWQYFGDQPSGSTVWWPNVDWCPSSYDPRLRPWYSAASTGPKDVVIVVDVSGSMQKQDRYKLAEEATNVLLDTLEWKDYASIVLFNQGISAEYSAQMVPVDSCRRKKMKEWLLQQVWAEGGTDFKIALDRAFEIIRDSVKDGKTSMCQKAILFLTDGKADFSDEDHASMQELSTRYDTTIFSYTLGDGADKTVAKKLACENGGVFYPVPDGGDLTHIMAQYYSFFAAGQQVCMSSFTAYSDVVTGTELWPACLPIYDRTTSQAKLLGVTCMDINVMADPKDLRNQASWSDFTCKVSDMTKQCRPMALSDCHREKIRREYSEESVCDAAYISGEQKTCPCVDPSCKDDEDWIDELGYFCDTWIGDDCTKAQEQWGYSWQGTQDVLRKCRQSCGSCPFQDPCPYNNSSPCQGHTFSARSSTCRACRTDKVSGVDIEGLPMCCASKTGSCTGKKPSCGEMGAPPASASVSQSRRLTALLVFFGILAGLLHI